MKKVIFAFLLLGLSIAPLACGYSFRHNQSNLPPEIKTVAIPMFTNQTNEVGIEATVTEQMRFQFTQSQILKLTPRDKAAAVIVGEVIYISGSDMTLTSSSTVQSRRVGISVLAKLVRADNGAVLYNGGASQYRAYIVYPSDNASTEQAYREALRLAARDLAQTIHDGILQNF